jgi:hypothetical protein|eukprot:SAG25_NODE_1049_length_4179_cov_2.842157_3_plen_103_part_00
MRTQLPVMDSRLGSWRSPVHLRLGAGGSGGGGTRRRGRRRARSCSCRLGMESRSPLDFARSCGCGCGTSTRLSSSFELNRKEVLLLRHLYDGHVPHFPGTQV